MAHRTVYQQATEGFTGNPSSITIPTITNQNSWQMPAYIMTAITTSCQFNGRDDEDAPAHIARLTRILKTFNLQGASEDAIFLQLFPSLLRVGPPLGLIRNLQAPLLLGRLSGMHFLRSTSRLPRHLASMIRFTLSGWRQMSRTTKPGSVFITCLPVAPSMA